MREALLLGIWLQVMDVGVQLFVYANARSGGGYREGLHWCTDIPHARQIGTIEGTLPQCTQHGHNQLNKEHDAHQEVHVLLKLCDLHKSTASQLLVWQQNTQHFAFTVSHYWCDRDQAECAVFGHSTPVQHTVALTISKAYSNYSMPRLQ